MRLSPDEAKLFMDLYSSLIGWSARRLESKSAIHDRATLRAAPPHEHMAARDRLFDEPALIDAYVAENPDALSSADLEQVGAWRRFVRGEFMAERDLKRHTIFLRQDKNPTAYGVLSLTEEIVDLLPMPLPTLVDAVLLPWRGTIVCDGIIRCSRVHLGAGIRREMRDAYREAKERGVVTSLNASPSVQKPTRSVQTKTARDPKQAFVGTWQIVKMETWDQDYVEAQGAAVMVVRRRGRGSLAFGLVEGETDCRFAIQNEIPLIEFTWQGHDEGHPVCGRGRARLATPDEMRGRIFIHLGDESEFFAKRVRS